MNHPALEIEYDPSDELKLRYELLRHQQPHIRTRDAAHQLNISEGELIAAHAGDTSFHLYPQPEAILRALEAVGEVLIITRNDTAIHEKKGVLRNLSFNNQGGVHSAQSIAPGLKLNLLLNHWCYCFLVSEEQHIGRNKSLQFFDSTGQAVHKIYLTQHSNIAVFNTLVRHFISPSQPTYLDIPLPQSQSAVDTVASNDPVIDDSFWQEIRQQWETVQSSHDFFQVLIGNQVSRQQAYDKVGTDLAYQVTLDALAQLCARVSQAQCGMSLAVGNRGCMQVHRGSVNKVSEYGPWFNILDADFNLHINTHKLTQAWVVKKPSLNGASTSVEFFDDTDTLVLQVFAHRQADSPEPAQWRDLLAQLTPITADSAASYSLNDSHRV